MAYETTTTAKAAKKPKTSRRQRDLQRWKALVSERSSWDSQYREIADLFLPRRFRKNLADTNRGTKKNEKILNPVGGISIRTLAAGMMAGIMSPSRPWLRLSIADEQLAELEEVKAWLHDCTQLMLAQFARTNIYKATAGSVFPDLAGWGTNLTMVLKDRKTVLRAYPCQIGSYVLASSCDGTIDTAMRELNLTVAQVVEEFGSDAVSPQVKKLWEDEKYDQRVPVLHIVEPNPMFDPSSGHSSRKRWSSRWMEANQEQVGSIGYLRESGHDRFPGLAPRWSVDGEDTYGRSPGMDAVPSGRQVQKLEYRLALMVALLSAPPSQAPVSMRDNGGVDLSPAGVSWKETAGGANDKVEPIVEAAPLAVAIDKVEAAIKRREERIREAFFVDFWLAMLEDPRATPATAEEVRAKKEERMLQLGPVLEAIQTEYLEPLVELLFDAMMERELLPPPPQVLVDALLERGQSSVVFDVEYVSIAATAQKALGLTSIKAFLELVLAGGQVDASTVDLVDVDVLVLEAARVLGINPKIVRAMDVVKKLRAARAQQEQAAQAGEAMVAAAGAAKDLGTTPAPGPDNGLGTALAALGPVASQLLPAPGNMVQ